MLIAQISDIHMHGPDQISRLESVVKDIRQLPTKPDLILVTGDCAESGLVEEYSSVRKILSTLTSPWFAVPGNHDNRQAFLEQFGRQGKLHQKDYIQFLVDDYPVEIIGLDTLAEGEVQGLLCEERLKWLEQRFEESPHNPKLLFLHHPPFPVGIEGIDLEPLRGRRQLEDLLARYPSVEAILCGHVHFHSQRFIFKAPGITCPSTDQNLRIDFREGQKLSTESQEGRAYLLHRWGPRFGFASYNKPISLSSI